MSVVRGGINHKIKPIDRSTEGVCVLIMVLMRRRRRSASARPPLLPAVAPLIPSRSCLVALIDVASGDAASKQSI